MKMKRAVHCSLVHHSSVVASLPEYIRTKASWHRSRSDEREHPFIPAMVSQKPVWWTRAPVYPCHGTTEAGLNASTRLFLPWYHRSRSDEREHPFIPAMVSQKPVWWTWAPVYPCHGITEAGLMNASTRLSLPWYLKDQIQIYLALLIT